MLRPNGDLPSASTDLEKRNKTPVEPKSKPKPRVLNKPGDISFVRNRLLYARAAVNAKGETRLGLRHIRMSKLPIYLHPD